MTPAVPDLPITVIEVDGQMIYQKTYKGTNFKVSKKDSVVGPFYVITKDYHIVIFFFFPYVCPIGVWYPMKDKLD